MTGCTWDGRTSDDVCETVTAACAAIGSTGTALGDDCNADARCSYNDGDTAATCTLPQATVDACAAITDESTCNDHESCTYDAANVSCGTTTEADACTAEAVNGEAACVGVTGCTWDDGTSDDVCETVTAACAAIGGVGDTLGAACNADARCSYNDGGTTDVTSDDVCEPVGTAAMWAAFGYDVAEDAVTATTAGGLGAITCTSTHVVAEDDTGNPTEPTAACLQDGGTFTLSGCEPEEVCTATTAEALAALGYVATTEPTATTVGGLGAVECYDDTHVAEDDAGNPTVPAATCAARLVRCAHVVPGCLFSERVKLLRYDATIE